MLIFVRNTLRILKFTSGSTSLRRVIKFEKINNTFHAKSMSSEPKKMKTGVISKIGTHNETFHCDEVLACYMLQQLENMKHAKIVRSRDPEILNTCDIVVDVGGIFDADRNLYDHHQKGFNETFSSLKPEFGGGYNIRLSSAGLVYVYYGEKVLQAILKKEDVTLDANQLKTIYEQVYKSLIMEIDAIDNGVPICDGEQKYFITTHLSSRVQHLNPQWNDTGSLNEDERFQKAQDLVGEVLRDKVVFCATVWLPAREIVKAAILNSKSIHMSGEIIELEKCCPWKDHLFKLEEELNLKGVHKYVLFCGPNNDWRVMCVPNDPNSFVCRKFLLKSWRGLHEFKNQNDIKDMKFCHSTGFIGGAYSREGVLQMAIKSLESVEE
ncbi:MYG1 exonuclease [Condylostylus longicornis]|uniref:MYG1 exonuclease n=1 Tax=Condylostylus longicornis TaxID=2530218 RepID=UPI00244E0330|nr:MYG1 exonuclease [Condylostylus longicornis]